MILSYLNNIVLKKNLLLDSKNNIICYNINTLNIYQSILDECKKKLLKKEIQFDNISTKNKKKNDENIISTNFVVNNLLNILNDIKDNFFIKKSNDIKKKKKKLDKNIALKFHNTYQIKHKNNTEKNEKKHKIFKIYETLKNINYLKNKYSLFEQHNPVNSSLKIFNKNIVKNNNHVNVSRNKPNLIQYSKNFIFFQNYKNKISNIFLSKKIHNYQNYINDINISKKINKNHSFQLNKKSLPVLNFKKNVQWEKAISQKVLLSIHKKENKAEICLKPEYLGKIYIKIKMRDDKIKLKFITDYREVKNFLNNCMPYLRDALIKNGIFLKKFNIDSSLKLEKNKCLSLAKHTKKISNINNNFYEYFEQAKNIDIYV